MVTVWSGILNFCMIDVHHFFRWAVLMIIIFHIPVRFKTGTGSVGFSDNTGSAAKDTGKLERQDYCQDYYDGYSYQGGT